MPTPTPIPAAVPAFIDVLGSATWDGADVGTEVVVGKMGEDEEVMDALPVTADAAVEVACCKIERVVSVCGTSSKAASISQN